MATELYIYKEIESERTEEFVKSLPRDGQDINLHVNSPGGDVFAGVAIFNALKQSRSKVHVYIDGMAASAASYIAMAGDTISIADNAFVMVHAPWSISIGDSGEHRRTAELLDGIAQAMRKGYNERIRNENLVRQWLAGEYWFNAEEAVQAGLADEIVTGKEVRAAFDLSKFKAVPAQVKQMYLHEPEKPLTIRALEKVLRDAGLTQREAKAVASHGWKSLQHRDDEGMNETEAQALISFINSKTREMECKTYGYADHSKRY